MDFTQLYEQVPDLIMMYGLRIIYALAIFVVGRWVAMGVTGLTKRLMINKNVDRTIVNFAASLLYVGLLAFVIIAALNQLGIQTASLIAVIGAAGLAIGLALQGSLSNFAAGVLMIVFKPFKAGDYVEGAGTAGTVEDIQIFTTQLVTPDNKLIIVPNAKMMGDNIVNYSARGTRRLDLVFGIGYDDDIDKARGIIREVIEGDERVMPDPAPVIVVSSLGDSSVNLTARAWATVQDYWNVFFEATETIKKRFDAEGISIPFPQRDVHLYRHDAPDN